MHSTANPFKLGIQEDLDVTEKHTQTLIRATKAILNKLTPEREELLKARFCSEIKPDTFERLEKARGRIFSKILITFILECH